MGYTVNEALADAKLRANYPSTGGSVTDAELLTLGNDEMQGILSSRLIQPMAGYFLTEYTQAVTYNSSTYDIPTRAIGAKLAYVALIDASGNRYDLPVALAGDVSGMNRVPAGTISLAYLQGNSIVLVPNPGTSQYSLVIGYYQRPGQMVLTASADRATAKTPTTVSTASTTVFTTGTSVDFVKATPHFTTLGADATLTGAGSTTLTFASGVIPSSLAVGDYVCAAGQSCVVQLPVEVQPLLKARWALRILRQRGDVVQANALKEDVADLEDNIFTFLTNRVESQVNTLGPPQLISRRAGIYGFSGFSW